MSKESRKKKLELSCLAMLFIVGLILAGCSQKEEVSTAPIKAKTEVIHWKVQGITPAGLPFHDLLVRLAESIEQMSGGNLVFDVYPAGAVVPASESLDAVQSGVLDAEYDYSGMWMGKHKVAPLFCSTPGVFGPYDRIMWEYEGGGKELREEFYTKVLGLDVHPIVAGAFGPEIFLWTNKPVRSLEDLKGKKIRMMPLMSEVLSAHGISTVFLPYSEVIPALEKGVIDAAEYSLPFFDVKGGFRDVSKYYVYPGLHQPSSMQELIINGDKWRALPDDLKKVVEFTCHEQTFWAWHYSDKLNIEALEKFNEMGIKEIRLEPEMVAKLLDWANDYLDEQATKDDFFAKVWNSQKEWMEKWYPYVDSIHFSHKLEG